MIRRLLDHPLESRLLETLSEDELVSLRREAETELAEPGRWGTTFTLIQALERDAIENELDLHVRKEFEPSLLPPGKAAASPKPASMTTCPALAVLGAVGKRINESTVR